MFCYLLDSSYIYWLSLPELANLLSPWPCQKPRSPISLFPSGYMLWSSSKFTLWSQKQPHSSPSKTVQTNPKLSTLLFVLMSKKKQKIDKTLIIIFFSSFMCQIRLSEYISINCYHWQKDKEDWFRWNMNKIQWQRIVSELDESWIPDGKALADSILTVMRVLDYPASSFHCMQYITCPALYTNVLLWVEVSLMPLDTVCGF